MKTTQLFCDHCKSLIYEKTIPGPAAGLEPMPDKLTIDVWSDVMDIDLVFCTIYCLKEHFKDVE